MFFGKYLDKVSISGDSRRVGELYARRLRRNLNKALRTYWNEIVNKSDAESIAELISESLFLNDKLIYNQLKGFATRISESLNKKFIQKLLNAKIELDMVGFRLGVLDGIHAVSSVYQGQGCTRLGIKHGESFFCGGNTDLNKNKAPKHLVLKQFSTSGCNKCTLISISPLLGGICGFNEKGVSVYWDILKLSQTKDYVKIWNFYRSKFLLKSDNEKRDFLNEYAGFSPSALVLKVLYTANSVDDALNIFSNISCLPGGIFLVCDKNKMLVIEKLGKDMNVVGNTIVNNCRLTACTNHSQAGIDGAVGGEFKDSAERLNNAIRLLNAIALKESVDSNDIAGVLKTHDNGAICRHGDIETVFSVLFRPSDKFFNLAVGKPCCNKYKKQRL